MAKTLNDVELKTMGILDGIEGTTKKGKNWKLLLLVPVALATVGGGAYFVVRRFFASAK